MRHSRTLMIGIVVGLTGAAVAQAWDKEACRAAAARAEGAFSGTSFLAKIPLGQMVHYYVLPDGTPATKSGKAKKQGKGGVDSGSISFVRGGTVAQGDRGEQVRVWAQKDQIQVALYKKRGAKLNPALVHVLFDRETTPADFDPHDLARAVEGLVVIGGFEPGAGVADMLEEAVAEAAAAEAAGAGAAGGTAREDAGPVPSKPTVLSLSVRTDPAEARAGGSVRLILEYEVAGGDAILVNETRTLSLGTSVMPTYPVIEQLAKTPGLHATGYEQPLPASATPGTYTFKGEVCVAGDCIARSMSFEVR